MQGLRAGLAGMILAMAAHPVFALELGTIHVQSRLNEPFRATIPLTASPGELIRATASLASPDEFARQGVIYAAALSSLHFRINAQSSPPSIEVTSDSPVSDPYLNFLVRFSNPAGSQESEFTVLLAGGGEGRTPHHASHPPAEVAAPVASDEETPTAAPEHSVTLKGAGKNSYGPVPAGQTLWRVANRVRAAFPDVDLSTEQVMLALYRANPDAFDGGKITGLRSGAMLRIPPVKDITVVAADTAKASIQELRHQGHLPKSLAQAKGETPTVETPTAHPPSNPPPSEMPKALPPSIPVGGEARPASAAPSASAGKAAAVAAVAAAAPAAGSSAANTGAGGQTKAAAPAASTVAAAAPSAPSSAALGAASSAAAASSASQAAAASSLAGLAAATTSGKPLVSPLVPPAPGALKQTQNEGFRPSIEPLITALGVLVLGLIALRLLRRPSVDSESRSRTPPGGDPFGIVPDVATQELRNSASLPPREPEPPPPAYLSPGPSAASYGMQPPLVSSVPPSFGASVTPPPAPVTPPPPIPPVQPVSTPTIASVVSASIPAAPAAPIPPIIVAPPAAAVSSGSAISKEAVDDALADADFHIEYGLYDEAATLLKRALSKEPSQAALLEKLAEVYAIVRKPTEFEQVVAQLRGRLGEQEGERIADLRRLLLLPRPLPKDYAESKTASGGPQSPIAPSAELLPSAGGGREFDLSDFDSPPPPAAPAPPPSRPRPTASVSRSDLREEPVPAATQERAPASVDELANDLATKLDLARAYSDMGDNEAARSLIQEVINGPNPALRKEAEDLLRRLGV